MAREETLAALADLIVARAAKRTPLRVAIDGVDASGKTTLADESAPGWPRRGSAAKPACAG